MISANELRIGNWTEYDGIYYSVWSIETDYLELDSQTDETDDSHADNIKTLSVNPIPLTPDILQKCGFVKSLHEANTHLFTVSYGVYFRIDLGKNIDETLDANTYYHCSTLVKLKHLHKLQNLYFALTENELNVQLCV